MKIQHPWSDYKISTSISLNQFFLSMAMHAFQIGGSLKARCYMQSLGQWNRSVLTAPMAGLFKRIPRLWSQHLNSWTISQGLPRTTCSINSLILHEFSVRSLTWSSLYYWYFQSGVRKTSHTETLSPWTHTNPVQGNCWWDLSHGRRVVSLPLWMYCDDTSGNTSKKWNEHNSYLFTLAGLPREQAEKEYNVHFLCTSNKAPPLEMLDGVLDQIECVLN